MEKRSNQSLIDIEESKMCNEIHKMLYYIDLDYYSWNKMQNESEAISQLSAKFWYMYYKPIYFNFIAALYGIDLGGEKFCLKGAVANDAKNVFHIEGFSWYL